MGQPSWVRSRRKMLRMAVEHDLHAARATKKESEHFLARHPHRQRDGRGALVQPPLVGAIKETW